MAVKKEKKAVGPIRYLLSADRSLGRISLKKMSERVKNAKRRARSTRVKHSTGTRRRALRPTIRTRTIVLGLMCAAMVVLVTARQLPSNQANQADLTSPDPHPEVQPMPDRPPIADRPEPKAVPPAVPATASAARTAPAPQTAAKTPARESSVESTVAAPAPVPTATTSAADGAHAADVESHTDVQDVAPVTITGCLELDEQTYRLKDTSGMDAPRSRSWKTGFLKKRSSSIEILDPVGTAELPSHVGQRVAATGVLANHELRVRSVRLLAVSCN